jgi:hypothetical protein
MRSMTYLSTTPLVGLDRLDICATILREKCRVFSHCCRRGACRRVPRMRRGSRAKRCCPRSGLTKAHCSHRMWTCRLGGSWASS